MYRQIFAFILGKKNYLKPINVSHLKNFIKRSATSSSNGVSQAISGNAKKGFLIYHYFNFKVGYARLFTICGAMACGSACYVSVDLHQFAKDSEPEVSEKPADTSSQVYEGLFGMIAPYIYGGAGIAMLFIARKVVNSTAKKILLSTDRKTVTFVSYRLFGKDKIVTVPIEDVSWKGSKIKVENYVIKYHLMKSGTITNRSLLLWALNAYQGPNVDPEIFKSP